MACYFQARESIFSLAAAATTHHGHSTCLLRIVAAFQQQERLRDRAADRQYHFIPSLLSALPHAPRPRSSNSYSDDEVSYRSLTPGGDGAAPSSSRNQKKRNRGGGCKTIKGVRATSNVPPTTQSHQPSSYVRGAGGFEIPGRAVRRPSHRASRASA